MKKKQEQQQHEKCLSWRETVWNEGKITWEKNKFKIILLCVALLKKQLNSFSLLLHRLLFCTIILNVQCNALKKTFRSWFFPFEENSDSENKLFRQIYLRQEAQPDIDGWMDGVRYGRMKNA